MRSDAHLGGTAPDRIGPRGFRPGLWLTLVTAAALAVLVTLGTWQVQRLYWKEALIAAADAGLRAPAVALPVTTDWAPLAYRRVTAEGTYHHAGALAFGLAGQGGEIGADLLVPFRLADGRTLLVDRGWLPEAQLPPAVPETLEPQGARRVEGVLRVAAGDGRNLFTPADTPDRRRVYGYDWPLLERLAGAPLLPVVLRLTSADGAGGLPRPGPATVDYRNAHLGYAITWYGLALGLVVVYVVFSMRAVEERPR